MSHLRRMLSARLDVLEEWDISTVLLHHRKSGINLWIGNGFMFLDGYGAAHGCLSLLDRVLLWPKVRKLRAKKVALALCCGEPINARGPDER